MESPCIKQTVCKVLNIFQHGKYLVAYAWFVLVRPYHYVDILVRGNVLRIMALWRRYDVRKFNADAILFGENHC